MRVKHLAPLLLLVVVLSGCLAPLTPVPPGPPVLPALPTAQVTPAPPSATSAAGSGTQAPPTASSLLNSPIPTRRLQATAGPSGTAPLEQPVVFPPGVDTVTFPGRLGAGGSDLYRIKGQSGQTMGVHLDAPGGQLAFGVMGVNGTMLSEYSGAPDWSAVLTNTQEYLVDVHNFGAAPTPYSVRISLTPPATSAPTQAPAPTATQAPPPTPAPPTSTQAPTPAPTLAQPTPTEAPATSAPTQAPPTSAPTEAPPTSAPTQAQPTPAPTQAPTLAPPTPAPTQAPTTPAPTQAPTTPAPTQAPPTPTPAQAAPAPTPVVNRVTFAPGATSATVQGQVARGGIDRWVVKANAGQTMSLKQNGSQLILAVWGADGSVLLSQMAGASSWSGVLPATQDYNIDVIGSSSGARNYSLTVTLPPSSPPSPTATVTAAPPASPARPAANRITFGPGAISATVSGTAGPGTDHWVIGARAGQTVIAQLTPAGGQVVLAITGADGTVLISSDAGATSWSGVLPATQDYYIDVLPGSATSTSYALTVTIPPG